MSKRVRQLEEVRDKAAMDHRINFEEIVRLSSEPTQTAFLIVRLETATAFFEQATAELDILIERQKKPWYKRLVGK